MEFAYNQTKNDIDSQILVTAQAVAAAAQAHGVQIIPYRNEDKILSSLDEQKKIQILNHLQNFLRYIPQSSNQPINDEVSMLKMAFQIFQIKPYDDVFKLIEHGDIIEIHTAEGNQIYRNLEMFKVCSFSLLELISCSWTELYLRSQRVIECMITQSVEVMKNPAIGTVSCRYPHHIVTENAKVPYTILLNFKFISPLMSIESGQPMGVLTIKTGKVTSQGLESEKFSYI